MELITYKNHEIIIDGIVTKIYKNNDLISKTAYYFYKQSDILRLSKHKINENIKISKSLSKINIYA